jgi:hypothetical protein
MKNKDSFRTSVCTRPEGACAFIINVFWCFQGYQSFALPLFPFRLGDTRRSDDFQYMSNRGKRIQKEIGTFLKSYERKAQRGVEPNDRHYDRDMEKKVKSLEPEVLNELMHGEFESGVPEDIEDRWFAGQYIDGIDFSLNESVTIVDGIHEGWAGCIITLLRLKPEPEYLVELGSGAGDIKAFQSKLKKKRT